MRKTLFALVIIASFGMGYAFCKMTAAPKTGPYRKVTGLGGIFFKSRNPKKLKEWYAKNLGLNMGPFGTIFEWRQARDSSKKGGTVWTPFNEKTTYFAPSTKDFMINYRVENLVTLTAQLRKEGVEIIDTIETYDYGKFVHIMDLEHNKIELWEPNDDYKGSDSARTN
jgi:predicted enzyme related to lactoylglutathione lyase